MNVRQGKRTGFPFGAERVRKCCSDERGSRLSGKGQTKLDIEGNAEHALHTRVDNSPDAIREAGGLIHVAGSQERGGGVAGGSIVEKDWGITTGGRKREGPKLDEKSRKRGGSRETHSVDERKST